MRRTFSLLALLLFISIASLSRGSEEEGVEAAPVPSDEDVFETTTDERVVADPVANVADGEEFEGDSSAEDASGNENETNAPGVATKPENEGVEEEKSDSDAAAAEDVAAAEEISGRDTPVDGGSADAADGDTAVNETDVEENDIVDTSEEMTETEATAEERKATAEPPVQSGPFIDLFGDTLLSLEMIDKGHAQLHQKLTNEALSEKKVVGLYFSADWCGPCRQFTPDLVNFYNKMNTRRGKENEFEIVWVSRCKDFDSFGQYFTQMNWLALQPEDAMGQRGQMLSDRYKVKGIPSLVLLDEVGNVITTDGRNKIPMDKAGIGFPWRNPIATAYVTIVPKSLRLMIRSHVDGVKGKILKVFKGAIGLEKATA